MDDIEGYRVIDTWELAGDTTLVFAVYRRGSTRYGSARIHREGRQYSGPTRAGFDMTGDTLAALVGLLENLSETCEAEGGIRTGEAGRIKVSRSTSWVVSVVEPDARRRAAAVDIRKFVSSKKYTGWTRKGLRLSLDLIDDLIPRLRRLVDALEKPVDPGEEERGCSDASQDADDACGDWVAPEYRDFF